MTAHPETEVQQVLQDQQEKSGYLVTPVLRAWPDRLAGTETQVQAVTEDNKVK